MIGIGALVLLSPTLFRVSSRIIEALSAPKLISLSFPNLELTEKWAPSIIEAVAYLLPSDGQDISVIELLIEPGDESPFEKIVNEVGDAENLADFVSYYSQGYLFVLKLEDGALPPKWGHLIGDIVSAFGNADASEYYPKVILVDCRGHSPLQQWSNDPSIAQYQLWNPITWEEMRLRAAFSLSDESNEIRRAWMVSTFSGAANFDPLLLNHLVDLRPRSLAAVIKTVKEFVGSRDQAPEKSTSEPVSYGSDWRVPESQVNAWKAGHLMGASIDRGAAIPWGAQKSYDIDRIARHVIWREQVSGLFALLIEVGNRTNEKVFERIGNEWLDTDEIATEPGVVLNAFFENKHTLPRMPQNLFDQLHNLRTARNDLAHLRPIDSKILETIWDLDARIRLGQY